MASYYFVWKYAQKNAGLQGNTLSDHCMTTMLFAWRIPYQLFGPNMHNNCISRKDGKGGGGWGHPQAAVHMVAARLGCKRAMAGTGWPLLALTAWTSLENRLSPSYAWCHSNAVARVLDHSALTNKPTAICCRSLASLLTEKGCMGNLPKHCTQLVTWCCQHCNVPD